MAREYFLNRPAGGASPSIDFRAELNEEQYAAVVSPPGHALVIAGAGSGKTRTLTYRVAWLLAQGVRPREVLLLTFTNKAAREMTGRVRELVGDDTSDLWAGTFHSIGSRILRRHADLIGHTPAFSILDRDDQKSMIQAVVTACDIDTSQRRFPKADVLASMFSLAENTGNDIRGVVAVHYPRFLEWSERIAEVRDGYVERKEKTNSLDFDDLLVKTVGLFEEHPDVLAAYRRRFRHILVDEYQDTNCVQGRMIDLLSGDGSSLMVVGDDAQSIYSWRGADVELILGFPRRHAGCAVHTIRTNYRSVPEILGLSNAAIGMNQMRHEKELVAHRASAGNLPALVPLPDPDAQAAFVAQRIEELLAEGTSAEEVAVLYRAHFQSLEIQMELTARGIPFRITSGLRFFEQAHIKDVAAFMRFVTNRRDEVSFLRMAALLPGCGPATVAKLWGEWMATGLSNAPAPPAKWSELLLRFKVPAKAARYWEQLCHTLDELTPGGSFARPSDMIFSILEGVYDDHLGARYDNADLRRADIEQLSSFAAGFEDIHAFLEQLALLGEADAAEEKRVQERVTLSSVHQAKGLEWGSVFVVWLAEGQFPNNRVLETLDEQLLEEERRLFYVAATRAKDELYLCYPMMNPKAYSGDLFCRPSSFLTEIPASLMERWEVDPYATSGEEDPF